MAPRTGLFVPWLCLASLCSVAMWLTPGEETIPYHVAWIGVALAYGLDPWPLRRTLLAIGCYTVATGAILVVRAWQGVVAWEETAEIPLMAVLVLLTVWHVRRRHAAMAELTRMAARDRALASQRERLSRMTSHEMRTPLTIAGGYVELLLERDLGPEDREDLEVVQDELGRLNRASARLVRMMELQGEAAPASVDLDSLLHQVAARWAAVADRRWVVDATAGTCDVSAERIRAGLDTLIENALRYTEAGDVVRLCAHHHSGMTYVGVADSGAGLDEDIVAAINRQDFAATERLTVDNASESCSQTGLGLSVVHEVAASRGGWVLADTSAEGGARVLMVIPAPASGAGSRTPAPRPAYDVPLTV